MSEMKDRNGNPLQPATYRGQLVLVDVSGVLLSSPPQYNIRYLEDGRRGYAICHEVEFNAENPFKNNPTEEELRAEIARANQEYFESRKTDKD